MGGAWSGLTLLIGTIAAGVSLAQTPVPPTPPAPATPVTSSPTVAPPPAALAVWRLAPAGSEVLVELAEPVGTRGHKPGDHFKLRLAEPLIVGDQVVIPAGAAGEGEIIDVGRPGMGGRPAKLILAARYVETGGTRVALHAFRLGGMGDSRKDAAAALAAAPYIGILALAVTGGDLEYPIGARARAKVLADVRIPPPDPGATPTEHSTGAQP
ncbi:MAG TPA: hypothetical protein VKQ54_09085 [Caulobacteraceae bacterium]|nr:hypothetical protein [Caulobacteraceae bacterium]